MRKATKVETVIKDKKSVITSTLDVYTLQEESACKCIVKSPWLTEEQKCTMELLNNIKTEDASELDKFIDKLNFPNSDVVEKSSGQSEVSKSSETQ